MTYKAYIDNIRAKTGKTPEDFRKMAKEKGLVKYGDLLKWLKTDCGLGHGHANAIIMYSSGSRGRQEEDCAKTKA